MKALLQKSALALGLNVPTRQTKRSEIVALLRKLRPQECGINLIRIGGEGDGGYLIPDDIEGIEYCFSPGVSTVSNFENQLADLNIKSFLADYSVEAPPLDRREIVFDKKFLGASDDGVFFTLSTWKDKYLHGYEGDLLLQMDIEDFEYPVILNAPDDLLNQFRIAIIEFHALDRLFDPFAFKLLSASFEKMLNYFYVVHIHPNNCHGSVRIGKIEIPRTMEFTFLNKRRVNFAKPQQVFPHNLDAANTSNAPLHLPKCWYADI